MCNLDSRYKFTNDLCFSKIMGECPELTKSLLELLLGKRIKKLKNLNSQKSVVQRLDRRGVRFDVYTEDEENKIYNIEMQVSIEKDLGKRSRYYHSMLALQQLGKSVAYEKLHETYVIFICKNLEDGKNKPAVSTYRYRSDKDFSDCLDDGTIIMIVNAKGDDTGLSDEMKDFLKYIRTGELSGSDDNLVHQLQAEVEYARHEHKWEEDFMILQEKLDDAEARGVQKGIAEGIEKGKYEGIVETLIKLVSKGVLTIEQAAGEAGFSVEDFQKLIK